MSVDGNFAVGRADHVTLAFAQLREAAEALAASRPKQGYVRAGSPRLAVEAVLALVRRLRDIGVGVSRELPEDVVLVLWRPSGPCAYLHPATLELLQACIAFDAWMGREERLVLR